MPHLQTDKTRKLFFFSIGRILQPQRSLLPICYSINSLVYGTDRTKQIRIPSSRLCMVLGKRPLLFSRSGSESRSRILAVLFSPWPRQHQNSKVTLRVLSYRIRAASLFPLCTPPIYEVSCASLPLSGERRFRLVRSRVRRDYINQYPLYVLKKRLRSDLGLP